MWKNAKENFNLSASFQKVSKYLQFFDILDIVIILYYKRAGLMKQNVKRSEFENSNQKKWNKFFSKKVFTNYTVMLVPHSSTSSSKKIQIHLWVLLFVAFSMLTLLILATYYSYTNYRLQVVKVENSRLNKISEEQEEFLEQLELLSEQLLKEVAETNESENLIRDKIGLEQNVLAVGGLEIDIKIPTTGIDVAGDKDLWDRLNTLEVELNAYQEFTNDLSLRYEILDIEVDNRLDYLACIPIGEPLEDMTITSPFGERVSPFGYNSVSFHNALDLAGATGDLIFATGGGTVEISMRDSAYGNYVVIDHGYGYKTLYAHNSKNVVSVGDTVKRGDVIAHVGSTGLSTGSHLHYEVLKDDQHIDPEIMLNNFNF